MSYFEIIVIAIGLSMDAFAVSICKGLSVKKATFKQALITGAWFGGFQGLMPLIGYLIGKSFSFFVKSIDHWIAFVLLGIIGANMIKEAFSKEETETDCSFDFKNMLVLAIATSIDALATGITFSCLEANILAAVFSIALITFAFSACGVRLGNVFGSRFKSKAEFAGGTVLILMGTKILIEHLFFQ